MADYYYYVKELGTATGTGGRTSTERTGAFSSMGGLTTYYNDIQACCDANTMVATDRHFIRVSDLHDYTYSAANVVFTFAQQYCYVEIRSVDDANADKYKIGAAERTPSTGNYSYTPTNIDHGNLSVYGIELENAYGIILGSGAQNARIIFIDCIIHKNRSNINTFITANYSQYVYCQRTTFKIGTGTDLGGAFVTLDRGTMLHLVECVLDYSGHSTLNFIKTNSNSLNVLIEAMDLSALEASDDIMSAASNLNYMTIRKSKFNTGHTYGMDNGGYLKLHNAGTGTNYQHNEEVFRDHIVTNDTANYLNATFDGSTGFSVFIEPRSDLFTGGRKRVKLLELLGQDLTTSTTYTVNFIAETTIKTNELWLEVMHPTSSSELNLATISSSAIADLLDDSTSQTTNSETWTTDATYTTPEKFENSVTVGALTGVDNAEVEIWVVYTGTQDISICPAVEIT